MAVGNIKGAPLQEIALENAVDGSSSLQQFMYIKSHNGFYLTADEKYGSVVNLAPQANEYQLWCVQFSTGGTFAIMCKDGHQLMISSNKGEKLQELLLKPFDSTPEFQWKYDDQNHNIQACVGPGNVMSTCGPSGTQLLLNPRISGSTDQQFYMDCVPSYLTITNGSDPNLVLEAWDNGNFVGVICNTKNTNNNNQLWKLKYNWADGTFEILTARDPSKKIALNLTTSELCISSAENIIKWRGNNSTISDGSARYPCVSGGIAAIRQVLLVSSRDFNVLQLKVDTQ